MSQPDEFEFGSPGGRVTHGANADTSTSSGASDGVDTHVTGISASGGEAGTSTTEGSSGSSSSTSEPHASTMGSTSEGDTSSGSPTDCGNGVVESPEACDTEDLQGATCSSEGFGGGTLVCGADCDFDYSGCSDPACVTSIEPPGGPCPAACTNGCDEATKTCYIDCIGPTACSGATVACPDDWACHVMCAGFNACNTATLRCPTDYDCWIVCDGSTPCDNAIFECGDAPCSITCTGGTPCEGSTLQCGYGDALLECTDVNDVEVDPIAVPDAQAECACAVVGC